MQTNQGLGVADVGEVLAALILVIVAIFAVSWLLRRMNGVGLRGGLAIRVLASMPLGQRERIVLVEVGGAQLLLGVTASGINRLHEFDPPIVIGDRGEPANAEFTARLRQALKGGVAPS